MVLDAVDQSFRKLAELAILQKAPFDETPNLDGGHPGILLDLVQDLEGNLTASGSSRHDQVASSRGHTAIASNADDTPKRAKPKRGP
jgi:hypothetical protein